MTAPDDASKVVFTQGRLHMAAQVEKRSSMTFYSNFNYFRKKRWCGNVSIYIQSPVIYWTGRRKIEYMNLPPNYHCTLLQQRTKLWWKEINPHKKPSLVPFPPSSLCHIVYINKIQDGRKKTTKIIHSKIPKIQKQLQEVKKHLENRPSQKWMFWFPNIIEISKTEKYLLNSNKNNYNNIFFRKQIPPKWIFWFKKNQNNLK